MMLLYPTSLKISRVFFTCKPPAFLRPWSSQTGAIANLCFTCLRIITWTENLRNQSQAIEILYLQNFCLFTLIVCVAIQWETENISISFFFVEQTICLMLNKKHNTSIYLRQRHKKVVKVLHLLVKKQFNKSM